MVVVVTSIVVVVVVVVFLHFVNSKSTLVPIARRDCVGSYSFYGRL